MRSKKSKLKNKKTIETGAAQMAGPSGPQYDTTGNQRLESIEQLKLLAGINNKEINNGSNISLTGQEKAELMKEKNIKPGTPEWFKLWFSRPYMTGEKPI